MQVKIKLRSIKMILTCKWRSSGVARVRCSITVCPPEPKKKTNPKDVCIKIKLRSKSQVLYYAHPNPPNPNPKTSANVKKCKKTGGVLCAASQLHERQVRILWQLRTKKRKLPALWRANQAMHGRHMLSIPCVAGSWMMHCCEQVVAVTRLPLQFTEWWAEL